MIHLEPTTVPFAISLVPFLVFGIDIPVSVHDWSRGRMTNGDGASLAIGFVIVVAWYWAILHSVRSKRRDGKTTLLGRDLDSWLWAPPIALVVGLVCGLSLLFV